MQPASLTISTEGTASHEITLTDLRDLPLNVTGVHSSSPHLTGEVRRTAADGAGHRAITVALSLGAGCPAGRHEETVVMLTDDPQYRELTMPVTVVKRPKQAVDRLAGVGVAGRAGGRPVPSRIVLLRPAGDEPVVVERVEADHPAVVCTWAAGPDGCATLSVGIDRAKLPADGLRSDNSCSHQQTRTRNRRGAGDVPRGVTQPNCGVSTSAIAAAAPG